MELDKIRPRPGGEDIARSGWFVVGALCFWLGFPLLGIGGLTGQPMLFWGGVAIMVLGFLLAYDFGEDEFEQRVEEFKENG